MDSPDSLKQPDMIDPRQLPEYRVALELEVWRAEQEEIFREQLSAKEARQMSILAQEWKRRDTEREKLLKQKVDAYLALETELKSSLAALDQREKLARERIAEIQRGQARQRGEQQARMSEVEAMQKRAREEYEQRVDVERNKCTELEARLRSVNAELKARQGLARQQEAEIGALREERSTAPHLEKFEADYRMLRLEKDEGERKLEAASKSKVHYKQQWGRALRELARIKQAQQEQARVRLHKQERELEHLRLRYLAAEEKQLRGVDETSELEKVKLELERLRTSEEVKNSLAQEKEYSKTITTNVTSDFKTASSTDIVRNVGDHVAKMIAERDALLQTGVYSPNDKVIKELDRHIRIEINRHAQAAS